MSAREGLVSARAVQVRTSDAQVGDGARRRALVGIAVCGEQGLRQGVRAASRRIALMGAR